MICFQRLFTFVVHFYWSLMKTHDWAGVYLSVSLSHDFLSSVLCSGDFPVCFIFLVLFSLCFSRMWPAARSIFIVTGNHLEKEQQQMGSGWGKTLSFSFEQELTYSTIVSIVLGNIPCFTRIQTHTQALKHSTRPPFCLVCLDLVTCTPSSGIKKGISGQSRAWEGLTLQHDSSHHPQQSLAFGLCFPLNSKLSW